MTGSGRPRGLRGGPVGIRKNDPGRGQFANTEHHSRRCRRRSRTPGRLRRRPSNGSNGSNGSNAPDAGGHAAGVERPRPTMVRGPPRAGRGAGGATEREHQNVRRHDTRGCRRRVDVEQHRGGDDHQFRLAAGANLAGSRGHAEAEASRPDCRGCVSYRRENPTSRSGTSVDTRFVIAPRTGSSSTCSTRSDQPPELGIRIHASDLFVDCDQRLYDFDPGQLQEETVMPIVCGLDVQWTHFTIAPRDCLRCEGCGRYSLEDVP